MNKSIHLHPDRKVAALLLLLVSCFAALTITQDLLRSNLHQSAFYFSESFIFSSFWWLFAPLWYTQYRELKKKESGWSSWQTILLMLAPMVIHVLAYPALVWLISNIFYYHNYAFTQTLRYTLSEYLYLLIACYSIPATLFHRFRVRATQRAELNESSDTTSGTLHGAITPINSFLVSDGNKKLVLPVAEVLHFSANPPYVELHLPGKKYLQHETLKSLAAKLDPEKFARIHKSTIVNIDMVVSCRSRSNGDYDLTMRNGVSLRLSRNFAADFNRQFGNGHRVTAK